MVKRDSANEHYKHHNQPGKCVLCTWQRNMKRWAPELPAILPEWAVAVRGKDDGKVQVGESWVRVRCGPKGHYRAVCVCCKQFRSSSKGLDLQDLRKHHVSTKHRRAMMDMLGLKIGPHSLSISAAPPYYEFEQLWKSGLENPDGVACRKKCDKMRECLFEAICEARREFLSKAETITVLRDESKGYLLIRVMACDNRFNDMVFSLGLRFGRRQDAPSVVDSTAQIIEEFCQPKVLLPHRKALPPVELAARIKTKIEAVCVDSASNELKAARLGADDVTPNLKVVLRDAAHASRRMLQRPWQADKDLNELAERLVMSKHSICQRIQNSPDFQCLFQKKINEVVTNPFRKTKGLGAAKHRFESWSKPFGMVVMTLKALILTAEEISIVRVGKEEAKDAEAFLDYLSPERILQVAMMADAADEVLIVTRTFDAEDCDLAKRALCLDAFRRRVQALFHGQNPACLTTGYTQEAISLLESQMFVIKKRGKTVTSFGGKHTVTDTIKNACLGKMRVWLKLCMTVVEAEFPEFDVIHCFWVFSAVDLKIGKGADDEHSDWGCGLDRLAQVFGLDAGRVRYEFEKCLPVAKHRVKTYHDTYKDAWKFAVENVKAEKSPCEALRQILYRYFGWGLSTSGVERSFASGRPVLQIRQSLQTDWKRLEALEMSAGMPQDIGQTSSTIPVAQEIWTMLHGPAKETKYKRRIDTGCPQKSGMLEDSREGWLRKRRSDVAAAVKESRGNVEGGLAVDDETDLPEAIQAEHEFQKTKRNKRKYEALQRQHLMPDEINEDLKASAQEFFKKRQQQDRQLKNEERLKKQKLNPKAIDLSEFKMVYVSRSDPMNDADRALVIRQLQNIGAHIVVNVANARIIVVPHLDPARIPVKILWTAMLRGQHLVMPSFVRGKSTAVLTYKPAVGYWRRVFVTDAFKEKHPDLMEVIHAACGSEASKWKLLETIADFNEAFGKAKKAGRPGQVVVLKRKQEEVPDALPGARLFEFKAFQKSIDKVDASQTVSGFG